MRKDASSGKKNWVQNGIVRKSRYRAQGRRFYRTYYVPSARPHSQFSYGGQGYKQKPTNFLRTLAHKITDETVSGSLLILSAILALILANSPLREAYFHIAHAHIGPQWLHLNLSVEHWASDGILTLFFFVIGLELKTEFVTGALRDIKEASLPMMAAVFGMIGPALVYVIIQVSARSDTLHGWAIPTATDIAFAVAVLGIFGRGMPPTARTFLLTLAVVDDLLAIIVIAVFYSNNLNFVFLFISLIFIAIFAVLVQRRITSPFLLVPLAILAWYFMHLSGVHATIAGVALGLVVPARYDRAGHQMTHQFAEKVNVLSAGVALPIFAFFASGVSLVDMPSISSILMDPVTIGVALALPVGKCLGVWGSVAVLTRTTRMKLGHGIDLKDIFAISLLTGIGFTVALLVSGLAFVNSPAHTEHAKLAVLIGTLLSCVFGALALRARLRHHDGGKRRQVKLLTNDAGV